MKTKALTSGFAILDVKKGRKTLLQACKSGLSTKVVITGYIEDPWGSDDGVSQEFSVNVKDVSVVE